MTDQLERLNRLPLRTNLRGLTPYGAPQLDVPILLNVNENTHGVPADVRAAISEAVTAAAAGLNRYPDREFTELREAPGRVPRPRTGRGEHLGRQRLQRSASADSAGIRRPGPHRPWVPSHVLHVPAAGRAERTPNTSSAQRADDYGLSAESAARQVRELQPNIVFLCSPNNPTGTGLGLDVVEAVYAAGEASQTIVIVDEAYHEFAHDGTPSALTLLPGRERLIVSRTMSKAFALAGARLGYMAAAPEVTDALRLVRLPYHLSAITQATALAALHHREALMADVEDIKRQRDRIVTELTRMGLKPAASDSNYVFFGGLENPHEVWQGLLDAGVLIRDVGIPGHLRVTAGTETETTAFLEALELILTGQPQRPGLNWNQTHVTRARFSRPAPRHHFSFIQRTQHMSTTGSIAAEARTARMERATSESSVLVEINLDGTGVSDISTSVPFYDHMLTALCKHSLIDMTVKATGDTHIDVHHTVEDVAITFGEVLRTALGNKAGIRRFGEATVPLDEALAHAVVDVSGRPYLVHGGEPAGQEYHLIGGHFTGSLTRHVFEAITLHAGICLHMNVIAGRDPHHIVEAQFKAFARALRAAVEPDPRVEGIPSTKGAL